MLDFGQSVRLVRAALEARQTDINIFRWICGGYERYMSWEQFSGELKKPVPPKDKRTAQQILDDTEALCARYNM